MAVRCQRIGCDATFTDDDTNVDGSCTYHDSPPHVPYVSVTNLPAYISRWHERMELLQAKKPRFQLVLRNPRTGKHTTEKPVLVSANRPKFIPSAVQSKPTDDTCSRCRQGFFCSDHGSQPRPSKPAVVPISAENEEVRPTPAPVKKIVGLNDPQICRNKGCGKTFTEKDNHETACEYHPGPAVFHDRIRGWKCCDVHVKEFDEFMEIPPCTKGWHNAGTV